MKKIVNEKGSALLITLIMTVMFMVLGTVLIAANINQAKQVRKSGDMMLKTNLAEMGIIYVKKQISDYISVNPNDLTESELVNWINNDYSLRRIEVSVPDDGSQYKYKIEDVMAVNQSPYVLITFKSIGVINNKVDEGKILIGDIKIEFNQGGIIIVPGDPNGPVGDGTDWGPGDSDGDGNPDWIDDATNIDQEPYKGNYRFTAPIQINDSKTVDGNAMFNQMVDFSKNNNTLTVTEDAFFKGVVSINRSNSAINVNGNAVFEGTVDYLDTNSMIVIGTETNASDAIFSGDFRMQQNNSDLLVYGSANFNTITINNNHAYIDVRQDAQFNGDVKIQANNDGQISIGCSAVFVGSLDLLDKNIVTIGKDAAFYKPVSLANSQDSRFTIGGNAVFKDILTVDQGIVVIDGNAVFLQTPKTLNGGRIVINGNLYLEGQVPNGVTFTGSKLSVNQYPGSLDGSFSCSESSGGGGGGISDVEDNTNY